MGPGKAFWKKLHPVEIRKTYAKRRGGKTIQIIRRDKSYLDNELKKMSTGRI